MTVRGRLAGALLLIAAAYFWGRRSPDAEVRGQRLSPSKAPVTGTEGGADSGPPQRTPVAVSQEDERPSEGGAASTAFLESYWGAEWPAMSVKLERAGYDLNDLPPIAPWERIFEVAVGVHKLTAPGRLEMTFAREMRWPGWEYSFAGVRHATLSNRFNNLGQVLGGLLGEPRATELNLQALERVDAGVFDLNLELEALIMTYLQQVEQRLQAMLAEGDYRRSPLGFLEPASPARYADKLYGGQSTGGGWGFELLLNRSDAPDLAAMADQIDSLKSQRTERVRQLVAAELE